MKLKSFIKKTASILVTSLAVTILVLGCAAGIAFLQKSGEPLAATVTVGEMANRVEIAVRGDYRYISANGIPNHTTGQFPNRNNPNTIQEQHYEFRVPLHPQVANSTTSAERMPFGVALNGIPFDPGTAEFWKHDPRSGWHYEAIGTLNLGLDGNNAHVQPNGAYHYHGLPIGFMAKLGGDRMVLLGYAADGFPIYSQFGYSNAKDARSQIRKLRSSYRLKSGTRPNGPGSAYNGTFVEDYEYRIGLGDLDECNGRFGITPEYPNGIYHYVITESFPFIPRLFRGVPDSSFRRRMPPGPPPPGMPPPPGAPPLGFPPRRP